MVLAATANVLYKNRLLEDMQYLNSKYASDVDDVRDINHVPVVNGVGATVNGPVVDEVSAVHSTHRVKSATGINKANAIGDSPRALRWE